MSLFNRKKKETAQDYNDSIQDQDIVEEEIIEEEIVENGVRKTVKKRRQVKYKKENEDVLLKGSRKIKDFLAPEGVDRSHEDHLVVGNKHIKTFAINGYPSTVSVGWLNELYNSSDADIDTAVYIRPADDRLALDELTSKITQYEAQLDIELRKGNIRNTTKLKSTIDQLYQQRMSLEQNHENLFHVQIVSSLYADSLEELNKKSQTLTNKLKGRKVDLSPLHLRQDDAYKSALPLGKAFIEDKFRNFNSGALTACFPFYNSDISHKDGVFIGINLATRTPVLIDFYDRSILNNSNASVFGQSGSGKTFFVSLLTLRSALKGIRTVIIDPDGEYRNLTEKMGGAYVRLASGSNASINPFDIEEEDTRHGLVVDIKNKIADLLNLIAVMAGGMDKEQQSITSHVLSKLYEDFGFSEDPNSLYEDSAIFDEESGEMVHGQKKVMPTLSDFHVKLEEYGSVHNLVSIRTLANALKMYIKGGVYDLFDQQTSKHLEEFSTAPIVSFDISELEEGILRPIGMYIALSWAWEKFAKKNLHIKKRIICDEAWMLMNKNMVGHEFTSQFLENCARRIRKRNGGLFVSSQNFVEFADNPQGRAVLTNSMVNVFLKQNSTDIDMVQETFKLSDGEKQFLLAANRGEMLIKMNEESSVALAVPFQMEIDLITGND